MLIIMLLSNTNDDVCATTPSITLDYAQKSKAASRNERLWGTAAYRIIACIIVLPMNNNTGFILPQPSKLDG
jgi:Na+/melibiose symporter-like transporter